MNKHGSNYIKRGHHKLHDLNKTIGSSYYPNLKCLVTYSKVKRITKAKGMTAASILLLRLKKCHFW